MAIIVESAFSPHLPTRNTINYTKDKVRISLGKKYNPLSFIFDFNFILSGQLSQQNKHSHINT